MEAQAEAGYQPSTVHEVQEEGRLQSAKTRKGHSKHRPDHGGAVGGVIEEQIDEQTENSKWEEWTTGHGSVDRNGHPANCSPNAEEGEDEADGHAKHEERIQVEDVAELIHDAEDDAFSVGVVEFNPERRLLQSRPTSIDDILDSLEETPVDDASLDGSGLPQDLKSAHLVSDTPRSEPVTDLDDSDDDIMGEPTTDLDVGGPEPYSATAAEMELTLREIQKGWGDRIPSGEVSLPETKTEAQIEDTKEEDPSRDYKELPTVTVTHSDVKPEDSSESESSEDDSSDSDSASGCEYYLSSEDEIVQHITPEMLQKVMMEPTIDTATGEAIYSDINIDVSESQAHEKDSSECTDTETRKSSVESMASTKSEDLDTKDRKLSVESMTSVKSYDLEPIEIRVHMQTGLPEVEESAELVFTKEVPSTVSEATEVSAQDRESSFHGSEAVEDGQLEEEDAHTADETVPLLKDEKLEEASDIAAVCAMDPLKEEGDEDGDVPEVSLVKDEEGEDADVSEDSSVKDEEDEEGDHLEVSSVKDEEDEEGDHLEVSPVKDEEDEEGDHLEVSPVKDEEDEEGDHLEVSPVKDEEDEEGDHLEVSPVKDEEDEEGDHLEVSPVKDEEDEEGDHLEDSPVKDEEDEEGDHLEVSPVKDEEVEEGDEPEVSPVKEEEDEDRDVPEVSSVKEDEDGDVPEVSTVKDEEVEDGDQPEVSSLKDEVCPFKDADDEDCDNTNICAVKDEEGENGDSQENESVKETDESDASVETEGAEAQVNVADQGEGRTTVEELVDEDEKNGKIPEELSESESPEEDPTRRAEDALCSVQDESIREAAHEGGLSGESEQEEEVILVDGDKGEVPDERPPEDEHSSVTDDEEEEVGPVEERSPGAAKELGLLEASITEAPEAIFLVSESGQEEVTGDEKDSNEEESSKGTVSTENAPADSADVTEKVITLNQEEEFEDSEIDDEDKSSAIEAVPSGVLGEATPEGGPQKGSTGDDDKGSPPTEGALTKTMDENDEMNADLRLEISRLVGKVIKEALHDLVTEQLQKAGIDDTGGDKPVPEQEGTEEPSEAVETESSPGDEVTDDHNESDLAGELAGQQQPEAELQSTDEGDGLVSVTETILEIQMQKQERIDDGGKIEDTEAGNIVESEETEEILSEQTVEVKAEEVKGSAEKHTAEEDVIVAKVSGFLASPKMVGEIIVCSTVQPPDRTFEEDILIMADAGDGGQGLTFHSGSVEKDSAVNEARKAPPERHPRSQEKKLDVIVEEMAEGHAQLLGHLPPSRLYKKKPRKDEAVAVKHQSDAWVQSETLKKYTLKPRPKDLQAQKEYDAMMRQIEKEVMELLGRYPGSSQLQTRIPSRRHGVTARIPPSGGSQKNRQTFPLSQDEQRKLSTERQSASFSHSAQGGTVPSSGHSGIYVKRYTLQGLKDVKDKDKDKEKEKEKVKELKRKDSQSRKAQKKVKKKKEKSKENEKEKENESSRVSQLAHDFSNFMK